MEKKKQIFLGGLHVRETDPTKPDDEMVIEGRAVVFGEETTLWDDQYGREREIIEPSCITREFLAQQDIKLNLLHDRSMSLCRYKEGVSASLEPDLREDGLYFVAHIPKCDLGYRCYELVKNGTYTGCSFEFYAKDYSIEKNELPDGREDYLVRHTAFERITALTIAMDPAYPTTSVEAREALMREYEDLNPEEARLKRQEDEEREARHQLALREQQQRARYRRELMRRISDSTELC